MHIVVGAIDKMSCAAQPDFMDLSITSEDEDVMLDLGGEFAQVCLCGH